MQTSLGPLPRATHASLGPPGERTLQNWSPARVRERGAKGQKPGASSQGPGQKSSTLGASLRMGLLRPSARSCLGEGLTRRPEPLSARRAADGRKGCRQAQPQLWRVRGGKFHHPGRPPPPPPPRTAARRSIPAAGACSRGARVTTAGWAGPSPPNVCPQGRSADLGLGRQRCRRRRRRRSATWPPLRRLATPLPSARGRAGLAGRAVRGEGGRGGGGVWLCVQRGGQERGRARAAARARAPAAPSLAGPPPNREPGHLPPPAPPGIPAAGRGGAHAQPSGRPWRTFLPPATL